MDACYFCNDTLSQEDLESQPPFKCVEGAMAKIRGYLLLPPLPMKDNHPTVFCEECINTLEHIFASNKTIEREEKKIAARALNIGRKVKASETRAKKRSQKWKAFQQPVIHNFDQRLLSNPYVCITINPELDRQAAVLGKDRIKAMYSPPAWSKDKGVVAKKAVAKTPKKSPATTKGRRGKAVPVPEPQKESEYSDSLFYVMPAPMKTGEETATTSTTKRKVKDAGEEIVLPPKRARKRKLVESNGVKKVTKNGKKTAAKRRRSIPTKKSKMNGVELHINTSPTVVIRRRLRIKKNVSAASSEKQLEEEEEEEELADITRALFPLNDTLLVGNGVKEEPDSLPDDASGELHMNGWAGGDETEENLPGLLKPKPSTTSRSRTPSHKNSVLKEDEDEDEEEEDNSLIPPDEVVRSVGSYEYPPSLPLPEEDDDKKRRRIRKWINAILVPSNPEQLYLSHQDKFTSQLPFTLLVKTEKDDASESEEEEDYKDLPMD